MSRVIRAILNVLYVNDGNGNFTADTLALHLIPPVSFVCGRVITIKMGILIYLSRVA